MDRLRVIAKRSATGGLLGACLGAAALVACSSDDFGLIGGSMPIDASQDSLLVELPPLDILEASSAVPELAQAPQDREILLLGNRPLGGWRATPLLRFDLSSAIPDTILTGLESITAATLEFEMLQSDANKGILRSVRVDALLDTLRVDDVDAVAVEDLLGTTITTKVFDQSSPRFVVELPPLAVWEWLQAGGHQGIALYDLTDHVVLPGLLYGSNFVGLAGKEFRSFSLLQQLGAGETFTPELKVTVAGETFSFGPLLDFTIVQRDAPAADALVVGAFSPSRSWLRFDLASGVIPGDATINRALLSVVVDSTGTIGERDRSTIAYEALSTELNTATPNSSAQILRSSGRVLFAATDTIGVQTVTIDVTDFVQRAVNLVVPPEAGILVSLTDGEALRFDLATFYGPSAPPWRRPKLSVVFTPPADTWQ